MSERDSQSDAPGDLVGDRRNADQAYLLFIVLGVCVVGAAVGFVIVLPSWKPTNNMERQPYYRPYAESEFFEDGMSARPLPPGVVPRPAANSPGMPYVMVRSPGPVDFPEIAPSSNIPVPITRELINHGQELFDINCSVCHSIAGDGDGMIVRRGIYSPPSYYIPRLRNQPDAYFYNVITNGYGTMFGYSDRVAPADRWAIVAYIRAMQLAVHQHPEIEKRLQKERGEQR